MYEDYSINPIKYVAIFGLLGLVLAGLFLLPLIPTKAQSQQGSFGALAGNTVCSAGLGCDLSQAQEEVADQPGSPSLFPFSGLFGGQQANLIGAPLITVINVEGESEVYRVVNGIKHSIPTTQIFYSYGLTTDMVQEITRQELDQYPTARLFMVEDDETETIYYLTDGGMLRPILNDEVFYSYGDRKEDIIVINQKEFNYYPRNQFIFLERPQVDRDIYQITGGIKRYLTPVAVRRMDLDESEIAPVNQFEFDAYPEGEPVIF